MYGITNPWLWFRSSILADAWDAWRHVWLNGAVVEN